jgi:hypothetical protein
VYNSLYSKYARNPAVQQEICGIRLIFNQEQEVVAT